MPAGDPKPSTQSILQSSAVLGSLAPAEMDLLALNSRVTYAERGEVIWLKGNQVDFFGLLGTGFVKMVRGNSDGVDVTIELMGPGQIFGMMGTIATTGCPLSAIAVTPLWYLRIAKRPLLEIYERNSDLKDFLVRRLTVRFHGAIDVIAKMSTAKVDERIAAILFTLAESYGERHGKSLTLQVPLTRQDISEMAGTTTESTIRVLSRWQKSGLITTEKHLITIVDEFELGRVLRN